MTTITTEWLATSAEEVKKHNVSGGRKDLFCLSSSTIPEKELSSLNRFRLGIYLLAMSIFVIDWSTMHLLMLLAPSSSSSSKLVSVVIASPIIRMRLEGVTGERERSGIEEIALKFPTTS